ncbi:hypothetical protein VQZ79_003523 [Salmonella enterica]|nr:hypothetical protein [Salmonella enterica subsp. enterica serovar Muenchen]EKC3114709.1 hypothetical protein [Salmonella enterica]EMD3449006.1 hypothetical protein [Salmonella enterica]EMD3466766.1 hypothetical protein [Salmonella enterica]
MNRPGLWGIPAVLLILLSIISLPARAFDDGCTTLSGSVQLSNVNSNISTATSGQILYSSSHTISYKCTRGGISAGGFQTHMIFTSAFSDLIGLFKQLGLGLRLQITETDSKGVSGTVNITWSQIQGNTGGRALNFGPLRNGYKYGEEAILSANINLELFVDNDFKNTMLVKPISGMQIMDLVSSSSGSAKRAAISTGGFNLRLLPDNLGTVDISPMLVSLGHFYTTDAEKKSGSFTVTARQQNAANSAFSVALRIRFNAPVGMSLTAGKTAVLLKNTGDSGDNGLQLSIVEDESGKKVVFDKDEEMGNINIGTSPSGRIQKTYHAVLDKTGVPVTGNFQVSSTVTVTYN